MHRFRTSGPEADMETQDFSLAVERNGDETVVRVTGEIDLATAPRLEECLLQLDGQPTALDFAAVTFMDATGISVLLRTQVRKDGLTLRAVKPAQMRLLEITGVADRFNLDFDHS